MHETFCVALRRRRGLNSHRHEIPPYNLSLELPPNFAHAAARLKWQRNPPASVDTLPMFIVVHLIISSALLSACLDCHWNYAISSPRG